MHSLRRMLTMAWGLRISNVGAAIMPPHSAPSTVGLLSIDGELHRLENWRFYSLVQPGQHQRDHQWLKRGSVAGGTVQQHFHIFFSFFAEVYFCNIYLSLLVWTVEAIDHRAVKGTTWAIKQTPPAKAVFSKAWRGRVPIHAAAVDSTNICRCPIHRLLCHCCYTDIFPQAIVPLRTFRNPS